MSVTLEQVYELLVGMDQRISQMEEKFSHQFQQLDSRLANVEKKVGGISAQLETAETNLTMAVREISEEITDISDTMGHVIQDVYKLRNRMKPFDYIQRKTSM